MYLVRERLPPIFRLLSPLIKKLIIIKTKKDELTISFI